MTVAKGQIFMLKNFVRSNSMEVQKSRENRRRRGLGPRRRSFTDALKEKYCEQDEMGQGLVIHISYHGKPKDNGSDAELAYLRNVVLCEKNVSCAGIPSNGLTSLCPNVVDLDISDNLLDDWSEVLNILHQLPCLKFANIARNKLLNKENILQKWDKVLHGIENLVLNSTGASWEEVLLLAKYLPDLQELHVCDNGYDGLTEQDYDVLSKIKCLRMNDNQIPRWEEIWKLRFLPELESLILSGNPLQNIFYKHPDDTEQEVTSESQKDENYNIRSPDQQVKDIIETVIRNACSEINDMEVDEHSKELHVEHKLNPDDDDDTVLQSNSRLVGEVDDGNRDNTQHETHSYEGCDNEISSSVMFTLGPESEEKPPSVTMETNDTSTKTKIDQTPFAKLKTLCVSETKLASWDDLQAVNMFPLLENLRCKCVILAEDLNDDDRRKMKVASLPKIKCLNGSEISLTEREKSERHYIRYFFDKEEAPDRLKELQDQHGKLEPIVDIDIGRGFKKWAEITFVQNSVPVFIQKVNVTQLVRQLKQIIKDRMSLKTGLRAISLYHYACGPHHHGEDKNTFNQLLQENLTLSRFDVMEGDEIHFEVDKYSVRTGSRREPCPVESNKVSSRETTDDEFRTGFKNIDTDGEGYVTVEQVMETLKLSQDWMESLIALTNVGSNGKLSCEDYVLVCSKLVELKNR